LLQPVDAPERGGGRLHGGVLVGAGRRLGQITRVDAAADQLDVPVVTRTAGDCHSRFEVLLEQAYVSLDLVEQCLDRVDQIGGPVNVRLPKVVKAPEGHTYAWTENPLGINGYYLVSRGEKTPWRMKLRTASYANVQALATLIPGCLVPDLIAILDTERGRESSEGVNIKKTKTEEQRTLDRAKKELRKRKERRQYD